MGRNITYTYEFKIKALTDYIVNYKEAIPITRYCKKIDIKASTFYNWLGKFKETDDYLKLVNPDAANPISFIDIKEPGVTIEHEKDTFHFFVNGFKVVFSLENFEEVIRRLYFYDRSREN